MGAARQSRPASTRDSRFPGESGYTAADPLNPDLLFGGTVEKCDITLNGAAANINWEPQTIGLISTLVFQ